MFSKTVVRQTICVSSVYLVVFIYGMWSGWTAPAIHFLTSSKSPISISKYDVTSLATATAVSSVICFILIGTLLPNPRRKTLILVCPIFVIISWSIVTLATSWDMIIFGQFLASSSFTLHEVFNGIYVGEIASPEYRGILISGLTTFYVCGMEFEYFIGIFYNYDMLNVVPLVICVIAFFLAFLALETPFHLLSKGEKDRAWKNMLLLCSENDAHRVASQFNQLNQFMEENKDKLVLNLLINSRSRKIYLTIAGIYSSIFFNGTILFCSYAPLILNSYKRELNINLVLNSFGIVNLVAVIISPFIIEKIGRKTLLIFSLTLTAFLHALIVVCFYVDEFFNYSFHLGRVIVVIFLLNAFLFASLIQPLAQLLKSEILPPKIKVEGTCSILILKSIVMGCTGSLFVLISSLWGMGFNFLFGFCFALIDAYCVHIFLIETKGKTLAEIANDYA